MTTIYIQSAVARIFDEYSVGDKIIGPAVTITEAHNTGFTSIVGNFNPIHVDEEYSKKHSIFGTRVVPGCLILSMLDGLMLDPLGRGTSIGLLEVSCRFPAPVRIGDTVHGEAEVVEKRVSKKYSPGGIVKFKALAKNQKDETVAEATFIVLIRNEKGNL